jgi:hypothetical protein
MCIDSKYILNKKKKMLGKGRIFESNKVGSNLFVFSLDPLNDSFIRAIGESALLASLLVVLVPGAQSLRSKVEGVPEGFVDATQDVGPRHEYLGRDGLTGHSNGDKQHTHPLKSSAARPRVRSHKDGLGGHDYWLHATFPRIFSVYRVLDKSAIFQARLWGDWVPGG